MAPKSAVAAALFAAAWVALARAHGGHDHHGHDHPLRDYDDDDEHAHCGTRELGDAEMDELKLPDHHIETVHHIFDPTHEPGEA
mmetsp:Transcript_6918/g.20203  ORF Transcript_6918/g.20203 Transcript_6918/m.20203 type:complete len:84 (-) Transcript_6918:1204-1455(-)